MFWSYNDTTRAAADTFRITMVPTGRIRDQYGSYRTCMVTIIFNLAVTLPAVLVGFGVGTLTGGASC